MSVSLDTLHQRLIKELWEGSFPLIATTASGTDTDTIVVAEAAYEDANANAYDGVYVYCPSVTASPKCVRVERGGFTGSSGTFEVHPAFGSDPGTSADAYFLRGLHINEIDEAINNTIRNFYVDRYTPLSLTADAGMEDSGVDAYTKLSGSDTLAKETGVGNVFTGTQSLKVTAAATDGGAVTEKIDTSGDIGTDSWETGTFYVSVIIKPSSTGNGFNVTLYDQTNLEAIKTVAVTGADRWHEVRFEEAAPDDSRAVAIRISSISGTAVGYVDSISLLSDNQRVLLLPSQVESTEFIERVMYAPEGQATEQDDVFIPFGRPFETWPALDNLRDALAVHPQRIQLPRIRGPLWLQYQGVASTLAQDTGDTETTELPEELVVQGALATLAGRMKARFEPGSSGFNRFALKQRSAHAAYRRARDQYGYGRPKVNLKTQRRVMA